MKKFLGLMIVVFLLGGWGSLHAYELDSTSFEQDPETEFSTVGGWDALKTYAVAAKKGGKGKKGGSKGKKGGKGGNAKGKKGGKGGNAKGKKGGNAKKGGSKGKRSGKTRCIRVIRGKDGRIIRVIPCPPRRPKSGR